MRRFHSVTATVLMFATSACGSFGDPSAAPPGQGASEVSAGGGSVIAEPSGSGGGDSGSGAVDSGGAPPQGMAGAGGASATPADTARRVPSNDAASNDAAPPPGDGGFLSCGIGFATGPSRCTITAAKGECSHSDYTVGGRVVYAQTPMGEPPAEGWPAVVVYQGSLYGPTMTWAGDTTMPFGGFNQVKLQAMLLDNGFAVIAPSANGAAWNTNFPGYETSPDATFIPILIDSVKKGTFGKVNPQRLYATGMSSGGYMTSRMAVSYPGVFRALAINSGSYATCSNVLCAIPDPLPADHPPTLFLHGQLDIAVPVGTAQAYEAQLKKQGIPTEMFIDPNIIHEWLSVSPEAVTCWFRSH
jgi:poly(3-hydroxyoctanoate) depolymerase